MEKGKKKVEYLERMAKENRYKPYPYILDTKGNRTYGFMFKYPDNTLLWKRYITFDVEGKFIKLTEPVQQE